MALTEKTAQKSAEQEQDRQKLGEKRSWVQEKFLELARQRYERERANKEQTKVKFEES